MKEHIKAKMINNLRDIAKEYHPHGCLRQMILEEVSRAEKEDEDYRRDNLWLYKLNNNQLDKLTAESQKLGLYDNN